MTTELTNREIGTLDNQAQELGNVIRHVKTLRAQIIVRLPNDAPTVKALDGLLSALDTADTAFCDPVLT